MGDGLECGLPVGSLLEVGEPIAPAFGGLDRRGRGLFRRLLLVLEVGLLVLVLVVALCIMFSCLSDSQGR